MLGNINNQSPSLSPSTHPTTYSHAHSHSPTPPPCIPMSTHTKVYPTSPSLFLSLFLSVCLSFFLSLTHTSARTHTHGRSQTYPPIPTNPHTYTPTSKTPCLFSKTPFWKQCSLNCTSIPLIKTSMFCNHHTSRRFPRLVNPTTTFLLPGTSIVQAAGGWALPHRWFQTRFITTIYRHERTYRHARPTI